MKLTNTTEEALRSFDDAVNKINEIEECHMIADDLRDTGKISGLLCLG